MEINCNNIIEKYLLNKNPLYAFSFPIALIVGIIFFGISKTYKWSENDYVNQILVPIVAVLLTMVLIDFISRYMISTIEKESLVNKCNSWKNSKDNKPNRPNRPNSPHTPHTPHTPNSPHKNIENFSSGNFTIQDNEIHNNLRMDEKIFKILSSHQNVDLNKASECTVETPICEIPNIHPSPLDSINIDSKCSEGKTCYSICSGIDKPPSNMVVPIPGPNWLPKSAATVQNELKNNIYTAASC